MSDESPAEPEPFEDDYDPDELWRPGYDAYTNGLRDGTLER